MLCSGNVILGRALLPLKREITIGEMSKDVRMEFGGIIGKE